MRHRDQETVVAALKDWRALRDKVAQQGGANYDRPVLVKFLDTGTFEVMDRDIVEDEFYVLRPYKILRELNATGEDLEQAIREAGREAPRKSGRRTGKTGSKEGSKSTGKTGAKRGSRRGRRRGRRGGKRGPGKGGAAD